MVDALVKLGFEVKVEPDPQEFCNRTITVKGLGGKIPNAGTPKEPLELFVGNAGTAARFLAALVCLGKGVYRLRGVPRMHERPQGALFKALREIGYEIESWNDKLPAVIRGTGPRSGNCRVSIKESSQFASALLLTGSRRGWQVEISGANQDEQPYVDMTRSLLKAFPEKGGVFQIEPDASSGSYFWGAGWLLRHSEFAAVLGATVKKKRTATEVSAPEWTAVSVRHWPESGLQVDAEFLQLISGKLLQTERQHGGRTLPSYGVFLTLPGEVSREQHLGDSIMTAAVLAPFVGQVIRLTDLGRLRVQESPRRHRALLLRTPSEPA